MPVTSKSSLHKISKRPIIHRASIHLSLNRTYTAQITFTITVIDTFVAATAGTKEPMGGTDTNAITKAIQNPINLIPDVVVVFFFLLKLRSFDS